MKTKNIDKINLSTVHDEVDQSGDPEKEIIADLKSALKELQYCKPGETVSRPEDDLPYEI
jgi:hypothetical protein